MRHPAQGATGGWVMPCVFLCVSSHYLILSRVSSLEKTMAPHSSTLTWKIPWMEEPGRLQSMGSPRVRHDWATSLSLSTFMHWRRKWHPTPVFLPGESQGRGSLVGCRLWGHTESDTTEQQAQRTARHRHPTLGTSCYKRHTLQLKMQQPHKNSTRLQPHTVWHWCPIFCLYIYCKPHLTMVLFWL